MGRDVMSHGQTLHSQVLPPQGVSDDELRRRADALRQAGLLKAARAVETELRWRRAKGD